MLSAGVCLPGEVSDEAPLRILRIDQVRKSQWVSWNQLPLIGVRVLHLQQWPEMKGCLETAILETDPLLETEVLQRFGWARVARLWLVGRWLDGTMGFGELDLVCRHGRCR